MDKEIDALKRKRESLSLKIREYVLKNKNAYEFVVEYNEMTDKLAKMGRKVTIQADHLKLENWTPDGYKLATEPMKPASTSKKTPELVKLPEPKKLETKPKQDSYLLCLAWTSVDGEPEPVQLQKVRDYFNELCLPILDSETRKVTDTLTEHVLKYEFKGSEDAFRLLKICTQFVLDTFAQTDFDKFNIAIFGKKKGF